MFCKYVIINDIHPVFFFTGIQHKELQKLGAVTSAGWVLLKDGEEPKVVGEALSLDVKPQPTDAAMMVLAMKEKR
jgi:hypothetical protein